MRPRGTLEMVTHVKSGPFTTCTTIAVDMIQVTSKRCPWTLRLNHPEMTAADTDKWRRDASMDRSIPPFYTWLRLA